MTTWYTVAQGKGGTGKTTTAAELVASLTRHGRRVLAIDTDEQGDLGFRLGITPDTEIEANTYDVLAGAATLTQAACPSPVLARAQVVVASHQLVNAPATVPQLIGALQRARAQAGAWDDVVIDAPANLGDVTLAGLNAANVVIAAVDCGFEGLRQLDRLVQVVAQRPGGGVRWIVPTKYDARQRLDNEVLTALRSKYSDRVTHPVRKAVEVADAFLQGLPVSLYKPSSAVAADYADALGPIIRADSLKHTQGRNSR